MTDSANDVAFWRNHSIEWANKCADQMDRAEKAERALKSIPIIPYYTEKHLWGCFFGGILWGFIIVPIVIMVIR